MTPRDCFCQFVAVLTLVLASCGQDPPLHDTGVTPDVGENDDGSRSGDLSVADGGMAGTDSGSSVTGAPIAAPAETWTWVEFPDTACGNGAPAGIGVNLTDRSDDVFVYFMGGGACWDVNTCFVLKSAVNIESGYGEARFDADPVKSAAGFDRDLPGNPLGDMSFVFVPYCTGDLHAGDNVETYMALGQSRDVHHVGGDNTEQFLRRLAPTFPNAGRVFVSGSSAGGYGAQLNFHRFVRHFPASETHVLSDSGPLLQPYGGRFGEMSRAWDLQTPDGCADCADGYPQWFDHVGATPEARVGLLTYDADQVIHTYWAYPVGDSFRGALNGFVTDRYVPASNAHVFALAGTQHVLLGGLGTLAAPDGTTLLDWVSWWVDGDSRWTTVLP